MKELNRPEELEKKVPGPHPETRRHTANTFDEVDIGEQREPTSDGSSSPPRDGGGGG